MNHPCRTSTSTELGRPHKSCKLRLAAFFTTLFLQHSLVSSSSQVSNDDSSEQQFAHSAEALPASPATNPGSVTNYTHMQGPFYVKNTYLRTNLKEDQTGVPLSLSIFIVDQRSCAPIENALVEVWGANKQGLYSGFVNNTSSLSECSSWLRGGAETDTNGVAKFETIYPGVEANRSLHLYAIVRTDWFEHSKNKTVDSDSTQSAAAIGQIFFPDAVNSQVLQRPAYQRNSAKPIKNEADPFYTAEEGSWKAKTDLRTADLNDGVQAYVTITVDAASPQKFATSTSSKIHPSLLFIAFYGLFFTMRTPIMRS
ncbi:hypothetical protein O181_035064 [Austropuccinia psidii MF-1]|uniref:Intradiol ring-cleavage dioxygenases domain-containing protein n=1 Tax=Austropuccinia psidii MF-1 TaxID=1389203 RepID=A0A9Q3D1Y5_9BASI|nr:hypothetical protein [Austropuccinia psidii MF-1]